MTTGVTREVDVCVSLCNQRLYNTHGYCGVFFFYLCVTWSNRTSIMLMYFLGIIKMNRGNSEDFSVRLYMNRTYVLEHTTHHFRGMMMKLADTTNYKFAPSHCLVPYVLIDYLICYH